MLRNTCRIPRGVCGLEGACLLLTKISTEANSIIKKAKIFGIYITICNTKINSKLQNNEI